MSLLIALAGCCGYEISHRSARQPSGTNAAPKSASPDPAASSLNTPTPSAALDRTKPDRTKPNRASPVLAGDPRTQKVKQAFERGDFNGVARAIDEQDAEFRDRAEVRLARARAAFELGDAARSRAELKLTIASQLEYVVNNLRAELAWKFPDASELQLELGARSDPEAAFLRILANCQLAQHDSCLRSLSAWLGKPQKKKDPRDLELLARTERLRVARLAGLERVAQDERLWLARKRPHTAAGKSAFEELVQAKVRLSSAEQTERLVALAEANALATFSEEFRDLRRTDLSASRYLEVVRARAFALYRARDSASAVLAFDELVHLEPERATEYGYYAARSLARQNLDREALLRFTKLARGSGPFADHAHYQLARVLWQLGRRETAISELEAYLGRRGKQAQNRERAEYDLAIFHLAVQNGRKAAQRLSLLLSRANDAKERARFEELLGVAHQQLSETARAEELFRSAIVSDPLSLAATLASVRLVALGQAPPALLEPSTASLEPLREVDLPASVRRLDELGLFREAEDTLYQLTRGTKDPVESTQRHTECSLFGQLERAERGYRVAQQSASARELNYVPEGPHRWHWECLFPTPHREPVQTAAAETHIPSALIYAVMRQESAFRGEVVSPAGAVGLMQLMPNTATQVAGLLDQTFHVTALRAPGVNVELGARYLEHLTGLFGEAQPEPQWQPAATGDAPPLKPFNLGRIGLVVLAYNAGPHAVRGWLEHFGDLPMDVFFAAVPYEETRTYGYRVLGNLARYEVLEFGAVQSQLISLETPKSLPFPADTF